MKIKRFEGNSEQEVIERVKNELGLDAIIVSIKTIKARGLFSAFKKPKVEVTAAYETPGEILDENVEIEKYSSKSNEEPKAPPPATQKIPENSNSDNKAFAADLKDIYKDMRLQEQTERIKALEQNVLTAQEMLSKMSKKLTVEKHKIGGEERKYKNNIIQVVYDSLLEQGVNPETASHIMDGLDIDFDIDIDDKKKTILNEERIDINIIVKVVYNNIIKIIGKPNVSLEKEFETKDEDETPKDAFAAIFIGPTGVGKTTTIAKLSADFILNKGRSIALISADTYRIAAVEQLKTYADILGIDIGVVYNPEDLLEQYNKIKSTKEIVFIDTAGRSHKHSENMAELKEFLNAIPQCKKFLVLSLTTKFEDMLDIVMEYAKITDFDIIFTKLDETKTLGSVLNLSYATGKTVSYITFGQSVPNDIRVLYPEEIARTILGGI